MENNKIVYEKMVTSGANAIVGGGNPELIGKRNLEILENLLELKSDSKILDFGCGCGRVALPLLDRLSKESKVVGVDIVPKLVDFCQKEIGNKYLNSSFFLLNESNEHYKEHIKHSYIIDDKKIKALDDLHIKNFDLVYAFSVFTHLNKEDAIKYLKQINKCLKEGGYLILSAFFLNPYSIKNNIENISSLRFQDDIKKDKEVYFANKLDKLAAVGFREYHFIEMAMNCGFQVDKISYGYWSSRIAGSLPFYQDVMVLSKNIPEEPLAVLPADFDAIIYLEKNPDVKNANADPIDHYLKYGYKEGRIWK